MITLHFVYELDQKKTISADGKRVFPVLEKIPPCIDSQVEAFGITFGLLLLKEFPIGKYFEVTGHTHHSVYVRAEDLADFLEYESRLNELHAVSNGREIEIPSEYVALFEAQEDVNIEEFWLGLSSAVRDHGVRLRHYGTEKSMRRSLIDRANFIAEKTNGIELEE